jgi:hypothetical protein
MVEDIMLDMEQVERGSEGMVMAKHRSGDGAKKN